MQKSQLEIKQEKQEFDFPTKPLKIHKKLQQTPPPPNIPWEINSFFLSRFEEWLIVYIQNKHLINDYFYF